jgi:hypothetical protein
MAARAFPPVRFFLPLDHRHSLLCSHPSPIPLTTTPSLFVLFVVKLRPSPHPISLRVLRALRGEASSVPCTQTISRTKRQPGSSVSAPTATHDHPLEQLRRECSESGGSVAANIHVHHSWLVLDAPDDSPCDEFG